ncbi:MAG: flagellar basal body protein FliL [Candidatus Dactylopiibacterium carminicum]|uniref:Flagellar protein FliL n=1 Tax=Candidatus Dactylopiibacterium carminicum TaxID=857335 RepID=A0A272ETM0_9RHOO|nr:flagellar basal body-associated FliL family protein [Candidatus Dactylopiibacterium carminicum]KAF7599405.1 flagellar basal body protein FliL [Candidatus Dactylopiibacterium carminicum]PAS93437.1 MAG: flagellar basal body protein FliL [Candidatus Dactylopiibacterium carminicum]PAS95956.1 MAG: flagellar basal body protein FliL [Candidatus Dactylopiibacterium carminicum]PAS99415.1 MAG: hypothetical protein BSR46_08100 [Candidatus Dactylopiibacterium carminicum]
MATKEAPKPAAEAPAAPPKSRLKLFILIAIILLLLAVVGVGALLLLTRHNQNKGEAAEPVAASAPLPAQVTFDPKSPPVFVPLEPFTVNLQPEGVEQYLQIVATLRVSDIKTGDTIKLLMPQVRHEVLAYLASKKASEITTPDGRHALSEDLRDIINEILGYAPPADSKRVTPTATAAPVISVFFTQFIVQ